MSKSLRMDKSISGVFERTTALQSIGAMDKEHDVIVLEKAGDYVSFFSPESVSGVCALEILELHQKADEAICYRILVDGTPVHVQSMEPMSDSLFPCFVKLSLSGGEEIRIEHTDGEIRIASVYLHADLDALVREYLTPMEIGFCFPRPGFSDYEKDLAVFKRIREDFSDVKHFTSAVGIEITYMLLNDDDLKKRFKWALSLSEDANIPLIFNFNSWWDATPSGRDGKGGCFSDAEYQQVVYDPLTGKTRLSIPNLWSNTPWLTMNNDHLNTARKARLSRALEILNETNAKRANMLKYRILIDNEPTYWAEFAYSQSPEAGGDFSQAAINAACKDGVDLYPRGEVTPVQKEWLYKNHSAYISDLAKQYHASNSREIAVLNEKGIAYSDNYLSENTLTHIIPNAGYPFAAGKHLMYEQHVTPFARLGLECAGFQDERVLSYASATGRFGQVNAERCCYTDPNFHMQFYAHGAFTDIIFNYFYDTDIKHIHALDALADALMPEKEYGRTVFCFDAYGDRLDDACVYACDNMAISPLRERRALRPDRLGKGSLTMKIGCASDYPFGGWVEITGLIRPENGKVSLFMGSTPDCTAFAMTLPERDADYQHIPVRVPMNGLTDSEGEIYLRLEIESNYYDDWAQMNCVWKIRAVKAPAADGIRNARFTLREMRALSSQLALRMDIERLNGLHDKRALPHQNYAETYARLMHDISVSGTRSFHIRSLGKIDRYGVEIVDFGGAPLLTFLTDDSEDVHVSGNPDEFVRIKDRKGERLLTPDRDEKPDTFKGTFIGFDEKRNAIRVSTHVLDRWNWQPYLDFACGENISVSIRPSEICGDMLDHISTNPYTPAAIVNARIDECPTVTSLKKGDAIEVSFKNEKVERISAVRGLARGRLISFEKMTLIPKAGNARMSLETAPDCTVTFELGADTHLNYTKAPAENAMLAGESDLNLDIGSTLLISFESEQYQNRPFRAMEITVV